jgi:ABC-type Mn2+/Zn2+ transport system permease subunit
MTDLLAIYWISVVASTLLGWGLALMGAQLAARDRAMQTMCVGQGAMLGVLLGIGLSQIFADFALSESVLSFAFAGLVSAATYLVSEHFVARKASSNTHFAALFSVLLAGGYLVSAFFPALENHMAQKYFGDLAILSTRSAWAVAALGMSILLVLFLFQRTVTRDSFSIAILGARKTPSDWFFYIGTLVVLCASVQIVGFLFTVSCLFLPTSILSFGRNKDLKMHLFQCSLVSSLGCFFGFLTTLWFTKLPTVPTIIATMVVLGLLATMTGFRKISGV